MIYTYILQFKINLIILHFYVKLVNAKHFRGNKNVRNYARSFFYFYILMTVIALIAVLMLGINF